MYDILCGCPKQPRQYVAGSTDDEDSGSNAVVGVGGAVLGIAIVGLGITALTSLGGGNIYCNDSSTGSMALSCVAGDPFPIMSVLLGLLSASSLQ